MFWFFFLPNAPCHVVPLLWLPDGCVCDGDWGRSRAETRASVGLSMARHVTEAWRLGQWPRPRVSHNGGRGSHSVISGELPPSVFASLPAGLCCWEIVLPSVKFCVCLAQLWLPRLPLVLTARQLPDVMSAGHCHGSGCFASSGVMIVLCQDSPGSRDRCPTIWAIRVLDTN